MDNPVQDIIIGNIPGASGVHSNLVNTKATVTPDKVSSNHSLHTGILKANRELSKAVQEPVTNSEICLNTNTFAVDVDTTTDMGTAVQTRAMVIKESVKLSPKLLKVKSVPGLDIGAEELKVKQKADKLLKRISTDEDEDPEVKTYHINMLKRYYHRESPTEPTFDGSRVSSNSDDNDIINADQDVDHQAASVACVIEEEVSDEAMSGKDVEALPLYNVRQKETVDDVIVNPQLSAEQRSQVKDLLVEHKEIFSDVTHHIEHKVELTESEPVKRKPYPIPYKMQEAVSYTHLTLPTKRIV